MARRQLNEEGVCGLQQERGARRTQRDTGLKFFDHIVGVLKFKCIFALDSNVRNAARHEWKVFEDLVEVGIQSSLCGDLSAPVNTR